MCTCTADYTPEPRPRTYIHRITPNVYYLKSVCVSYHFGATCLAPVGVCHIIGAANRSVVCAACAGRACAGSCCGLCCGGASWGGGSYGGDIAWTLTLARDIL